MPSDWLPYLQRQAWFIPELEQFAENFPLAIEHLLHPREFRREFFREMIRPVNGISDGYHSLARILVRRLCWTVLTTNFDSLIAEALREQRPRPLEVIEVNRTPDDRAPRWRGEETAM